MHHIHILHLRSVVHRVVMFLHRIHTHYLHHMTTHHIHIFHHEINSEIIKSGMMVLTERED
jgi:hypothetical protein